MHRFGHDAVIESGANNSFGGGNDRLARGSSISLKQAVRHTPFVAGISLDKKTIADQISHEFKRHWHKTPIANDYLRGVMSNGIVSSECESPDVFSQTICAH